LFSTTESLTENPSLRSQIHRYIFLAAMMGVCIGMPLSNGINSICQLVLALNWLVEGNYVSKFRSLVKNKPALVLLSFYVMHLLGLLYTTNFDYGLEDLNKKLPLFLFPLVLSTSGPLSDKEKKIVILSLMLAVTCSTFIGSYLLLSHQLTDIHDISEFIAPVRLAMMMVLSIFLLGYYVTTNKFSFWSIIFSVWIGWLFFFLFVMQSLTAVIMIFIIGLVLLIIAAIKAIRRKKILFSLSVLLFFGFGLIGSAKYLIHFYHQYFPKSDVVNISQLDKKTVNGNPYYSENWGELTENGHYDVQYICWEELKSEWNKRGKIRFDSLDLKGNPVKFTLIRYMTSMGLRKDSVGVWALNAKDINAVELGIPNYRFNSLSSMSYRLFQVFWEIKDYQNGGDANGHSVTMRLVYWKAALHFISKHPFVGVGTGDVRKTFDNYYDTTHSKLSKDFRLRSHNQYLEIGVGFGLIGIVWFLLSLFYPAIKTKKIFTYSYFIFWMIIMLSMLTEDTLETEAGSTFYAFFNSFFLFL
jgi:hypothetical protein